MKTDNIPSADHPVVDPRDVLSDTGNPEADRLIGRLTSADPDFNDCTDAAVFIRRLVAEQDERALADSEMFKMIREHFGYAYFNAPAQALALCRAIEQASRRTAPAQTSKE